MIPFFASFGSVLTTSVGFPLGSKISECFYSKSAINLTVSTTVSSYEESKSFGIVAVELTILLSLEAFILFPETYVLKLFIASV